MKKIKIFKLAFSLCLFFSFLSLPLISQANDVGYNWAKIMGGTGGDFGYSIAIDSGGNVYTIGYFAGTTDLDPGVGTANFTSAGSNDIFISKLDSSGAFVWAKKIGSTGDDAGNSIFIDLNDNIYIAGYYNGTVSFGPTNLISAGGYDIFVSKLNTSGNFVWAKSMGGTGEDQANSVITDSNGNIYTTGYFKLTADFDPGADPYNLTSAGPLTYLSAN